MKLKLLLNLLLVSWLIPSAWEYQSCDSKGIICMVKDYTFHANGTFNLDAYPPLRLKGKYKIVTTSSDGNTIGLSLSEQKGDIDGHPTMSLEYKPSNKTIKIDGEGPYTQRDYIDPKSIKKNEREHGEK